MQGYDSIMCEYVYIGFTDIMLKIKILLDYTNLFCINEYIKIVKMVLQYFPKILKSLK